MKTYLVISLIGLFLGLVGSVLLLSVYQYNQIPNISFNRIEINGQLVNEDKAVSINFNKSKYYLGISFLGLGFLLQAVGLIMGEIKK